MKIYLAGALFTLAERRFNEELAERLGRLCPALEVFVPQRYDAQFLSLPDFSRRIYACLMEALDRCDAVIAVLDGADVDSGTCIEIGYAKGRGKRVVGLRTDFRGSQDQGLNLMISNMCDALVILPSTTATIDGLAQQVVEALRGTKQ